MINKQLRFLQSEYIKVQILKFSYLILYSYLRELADTYSHLNIAGKRF
jgi:hypothetical protein